MKIKNDERGLLVIDFSDSFSIWEWPEEDHDIGVVHFDTVGEGVDLKIEQLDSVIEYLEAVRRKHS